MNQWVLIIILIVGLILLARPFLDDIVRGLIESIDNFKAGIRLEPRRHDIDPRPWVFIILALMAAAIILSVLSRDVFSIKQKLTLTIVLLGWIVAGYWAFGRTLRKRNDR